MRRTPVLAAVVLAAAVAVAGLAHAFRGRPPEVGSAAAGGRPPRLRPDYSDTVFPPNIAAPSFVVEEEGTAYVVEVRGEHGEPIRTWNSDAGISLPLRAWRRLLEQNRADGRWTQFEPVRNRVAREGIDPWVVYRRIDVLYNFYTRMQIRQRDLEDYADRLVLDDRSFGNGCMNCHTFCNNSPDKMVLQMRSALVDYGNGMLLIEDGKVSKVNTRTEINPGLAAFASWHPSGRAVAFSTNTVRQFFHSARAEVREGIDMKSDLAVYLVESGDVTSNKAITRPDRLETWPSWSADGKYLYFVSSPIPWEQDEEPPPEHYRDARYDLMRIPYDVDSNTWGEPETVLSARETGMSITEPRPSPDGRYLLVCMSPYGGFPALDPDADLYMVDPAAGSYRPLPCNSDQTESWHSWSSNSRWFAFSTKAGNGLFSRAGFCYVGEDGTVHKPFLLPQRDPRFYESCISLFQLPELIKQPVPVPGDQIGAAIRSAQWEGVGLPVTSATPAAAP
jgi:hypothetical protein